MTTCSLCNLKLSGNVHHDSPADCITALRNRLTLQHSALIEARHNVARRRDSISGRVERLEVALELQTVKMLANEEACGMARQRADFALGQVAGFRDQRRAS